VKGILRANARAAHLLAEALMARRIVQGKQLANIMSLVVKPVDTISSQIAVPTAQGQYDPGSL
jgi:hypothetical protein